MGASWSDVAGADPCQFGGQAPAVYLSRVGAALTVWVGMCLLL
jgi:hypothetical protein